MLASASSSEELRRYCGTVFALLNETAGIAAATGGCGRLLPSNRLHPSQALSIHVVLSNALRLGCQSHECWVHLLNACQLVRDLEHAYFTCLCDSEPSTLVKPYVHYFFDSFKQVIGFALCLA